MKRQPTVVAILFSIVAVVLMGAATPRGGNVAPVYYVIASDAPTTFKRKLRHTRVCNGTADDIEIQATNDAFDTDGDGTIEDGEGGILQLSPGTFTVNKGASAETVGGTGDLAANGVVSTIVFDGAQSISDISVGQLVRVTGGTGQSSSNSLETDHIDFVATVTAVGADNFTLSESSPEAYDGVDWDVMSAAIYLSSHVTLRGSGRGATRIVLADAQNCDVIHLTDGTDTTVDWQIEKLSVFGNDTNQTSARMSNGIVSTIYVQDIHVKDIDVTFCLGDGVWIGKPWGLNWVGGWVEHCGDRGICIAGDSNGNLFCTKSTLNTGEGLFLRGANVITVQGCILGSDSNYGVRVMHSATRNLFLGNSIEGGGGGIFTDSIENVYTNNNIDPTGGQEGITFSATKGCYGNVVIGNRFDGDLSPAVNIQRWSHGFNQISANEGTRFRERCQYTRAVNGNAGTINVRTLVVHDTDPDEFDTSSTQGDAKVWGITGIANVTTGSVGLIQELGWQEWFPIDNTETISVGDELTVCDTEVGTSEPADAGNYVIAIAAEAHTGAGAGTDNIRAIMVRPYRKP